MKCFSFCWRSLTKKKQEILRWCKRVLLLLLLLYFDRISWKVDVSVVVGGGRSIAESRGASAKGSRPHSVAPYGLLPFFFISFRFVSFPFFVFFGFRLHIAGSTGFRMVFRCRWFRFSTGTSWTRLFVFLVLFWNMVHLRESPRFRLVLLFPGRVCWYWHEIGPVLLGGG